ncbi:hypothetical protein WICPIJ_007401 [Wickerhamomyces pijperi]|uniref:GPI transamidase component GPI17 n=1 Tax=Wickerhamomyces pijperi TaxID=599730 RepID=A0A9P8TJY6_WICPI|nr:hypothetical protein WICPIJ_007401 [Wickerhamomyces pijperi]
MTDIDSSEPEDKSILTQLQAQDQSQEHKPSETESQLQLLPNKETTSTTDTSTPNPTASSESESESLMSRVERILNSEPLESLLLRRKTVLSMVLVYLFIGLPLWFKLTEIYRAPLPSDFISQIHENPSQDLSIHNYVQLRIGNGLKYPDLKEAVQVQVNHELALLAASEETKLSVAYWNVTLVDEQPEENKGGYTLTLEIGDDEGISVDEITKDTTLYYTLKSVKNNDLPFFITQTLLQHTFKTELDLLRRHKTVETTAVRSIDYSPRVHLSFKLLTGDGYPVQWEIEDALKDYFGPLVEMFAGYVDLSIDSEIKYFTELNLPETKSQAIRLGDLSAILDFSEWDVSSDQFSYPSLNFILYFPSERQAPLNLEFSDEANTDNQAFLIPQWGSIILHKDPLQPGSYITKEYLYPVLESFSSELFTLLGLPKDPKNPMIRLDALLKYTIVENLQKGVDSLNSLLKLTQSLPNISIPKSVQSNVMKSLEARSKAVEALSLNDDFQTAFVESIKCLQFAELAFFDNMMVQQNFFPQEHKIAVYMPLLGPLSLISSIGFLRIVNDIKLINKKRSN